MSFPTQKYSMSEDLPSVETAVIDREEHLEDLANRRGITPEEYRERLRKLDLENGFERIDPVDPSE